MRIRLAKVNDLDPLINMTKRCIQNLDKQGIYQWDEIYPSKDDFYNDILGENLYIIAGKGKTLGCICINHFELFGYDKANWLGTRYFVIHKLMVEPQNENQGIGKFAMHFAEKVSHSRGKDSIRLDCFKENLRANKFYEKLGYRVRGETLFRKGMFNLYEKLI